MIMLKKFSTPETAFTLLQGITALLCAAGAAVAAGLFYVGVCALRMGAEGLHIPQGSFMTLLICGFAALLIVSAACATALITFFRLCSRIKRGTAFTAANARAMGCIALCCVIASGALLLACIAILIAEAVCGGVMGLYWTEMAVLACAFLAVGAVAWALCLLVRRAVALQEDADLTV